MDEENSDVDPLASNTDEESSSTIFLSLYPSDLSESPATFSPQLIPASPQFDDAVDTFGCFNEDSINYKLIEPSLKLDPA